MKERYCPWCDRKYETKGDKSGPLCDECRQDLMEQPKEFLVDKLGHVAGVNALAMAALRGRRTCWRNSDSQAAAPKKLTVLGAS